MIRPGSLTLTQVSVPTVDRMRTRATEVIERYDRRLAELDARLAVLRRRRAGLAARLDELLDRRHATQPRSWQDAEATR